MADGTDDWFSNMFSGGTGGASTSLNNYSFDNPNVTEMGGASTLNTGGGAPRSNEYDLYSLFSQGGASQGPTVEQGTAGGGPGGGGEIAGPPSELGGDSISSYLRSVSPGLAKLYEGAKSGASGIVDMLTTKDTTRTYYDAAKKQMVTENVPGGQINDLGKLLLTGAVSAIGQGAVTKWQEERKEKAAKKEREFKATESEKTRQEARDVQAEKYRRTAYGEAPQLGVTRGILGGG